MPFTYQDSRSPSAGSISALMLRRGDIAAKQAETIGNAQARAAEVSGNAYAGAAQNIGQSVSGAIQQATDPKLQLERQQVAQNTRIQNMTAAATGIAKQATRPDGSTNYEFLRNGMAQLSIAPDIQDRVLKSAESFDTHSVQAANNAKESHADLGHILFQSLSGLPVDAPPEKVDAILSGVGGLAKAQNVATDDQLRQVFGAIHTKADAMHLALGFMGSSPSKRYAEELKPIVSPAGAAVTMPGQAPTIPAPDKPNEAEIALDAARGNPTSAAAMNLLKPKPNATAEQDDQRYRDIQAKQLQGIPVAPPDLAWAQGYEKQKKLSVDASAGAANERLSRTIAQQTAQQGRTQDFAALQAARADLEKNVNTPYNTAKTSANTLRDVVDAAKNGNTVAASMQALETTMAAIRAQGLNRINTAEIGVASNAGSLFQNIAGWLGKKAEGQPIPASVQKDMIDFAGILEKAAYKKYQAGHKSVNDLYGTKIPELLTGPATVRMRAPTGQETDVAPDQVDHYKSLGATVVKQ